MENLKGFETLSEQEIMEVDGGGIILGGLAAVAIIGGTAVVTYVAVKAVAKVGSYISDKLGL